MSHQLFQNTRFQRRKPTFGGLKQHLCAVQATGLDEAKPWFAWCKPLLRMKQAAAPHHPNPSGASTQTYLTYFRSVKFRKFIFTNKSSNDTPTTPSSSFPGGKQASPSRPATQAGLSPSPLPPPLPLPS